MITFSDRFDEIKNGRFESRGLRRLKKIGLVAILLFQLPTLTFAQGADWGKWVEPAVGSDKSIPPGSAYPGGKPLCEGMQLSGKHAYWQCMNRCNGQSGGYCWEGISDAIYTCPGGKGFRRMEKIRYTNIPCGLKDWQKTKALAELYEETWTQKIPDPKEDVPPSTPPTTTAELPPTTGDTPPTWDGGDPPWAPPKKEAEKPDSGKTDTGKTDTGKTDTGKKDATTEKKTTPVTEKKVTGTESGTGKKYPRKETRKQGKAVARIRTEAPVSARTKGEAGGLSPEAATAIGLGVGFGLGVGLGGRGRGERMDDRMMGR